MRTVKWHWVAGLKRKTLALFARSQIMSASKIAAEVSSQLRTFSTSRRSRRDLHSKRRCLPNKYRFKVRSSKWSREGRPRRPREASTRINWTMNRTWRPKWRSNCLKIHKIAGKRSKCSIRDNLPHWLELIQKHDATWYRPRWLQWASLIAKSMRCSTWTETGQRFRVPISRSRSWMILISTPMFQMIKKSQFVRFAITASGFTAKRRKSSSSKAWANCYSIDLILWLLIWAH